MNRLKQTLLASSNGTVELTMSLTMLAYGLPLLLPPNEFGRYPGYNAMAQVLPETVWGLILTGIAFLRICTVFLCSHRLRTLTTAVALSCWQFLCILFLLSQPSSPGVYLFGTWGVIEAWTIFRIRKTH